MSHLGDLFRSKRVAAGLTLADIARATGLKNLDKQIRVLGHIENGRDKLPKYVFIERFAKLLQIDQAEIVQAMSDDYAELARPYERPFLMVRLVPGFYQKRELPEGCSLEEAHELAREMVDQKPFEVALVLSRVRSIFFKRNGQVIPANWSPAMRVGSHGKDGLRLAAQAARVPQEPRA